MRPFTRTIPAGEEVTIDRAGRWITVLESTAEFDIQVMDQDGVFDHGEMQAGIGWGYDGRHKGFDQIQLINKSAAPNTIKLVISNGRYTDNRTTAVDVKQDAASNPWITQEKVPGTIVDGLGVAGAASSALFAGNTDNVLVTIQPQGGDIYIAKNAVATADANSLLIKDGTIYESRTAKTVYAIRAGAVDVNVFFEAQRA